MLCLLIVYIINFISVNCQFGPDIEAKITKFGKWPEFLAKMREIGDKIMVNDHPDFDRQSQLIQSWVKTLEPKEGTTRPSIFRIAESAERPSHGMESYWPAPKALRSNNNSEKYEDKKKPPDDIQNLYPSDLKKIAQHKLEMLQKQDTANKSIGRSKWEGPGPGFGFSPQIQRVRPGPYGSVSYPVPVPGNDDYYPYDQPLPTSTPYVDVDPYGRPSKTTNSGGNPNSGLSQQQPKADGNLKSDPIKQRPKADGNLKSDPIKQRPNAGGNPNGGEETPQPVTDSKNPVMPTVDDLNNPIQWVPFESPLPGQRLAKVTDPNTGRNMQFKINDTIYVPVNRLGKKVKPTSTYSTPYSQTPFTGFYYTLSTRQFEDTEMPEVDDTGRLVQWVSLDSPLTSRGISKVTDPKTGKNMKFVKNNITLVPVPDYSS